MKFKINTWVITDDQTLVMFSTHIGDEFIHTYVDYKENRFELAEAGCKALEQVIGNRQDLPEELLVNVNTATTHSREYSADLVGKYSSFTIDYCTGAVMNVFEEPAYD